MLFPIGHKEKQALNHTFLIKLSLIITSCRQSRPKIRLENFTKNVALAQIPITPNKETKIHDKVIACLV